MPNSKTSTLGKAFTINSEKENFDCFCWNIRNQNSLFLN